MSGIIKRLFGWSSKKKETERTTDKIELTQNTQKHVKKLNPHNSFNHLKQKIQLKQRNWVKFILNLF